jgi:hypothetical protein
MAFANTVYAEKRRCPVIFPVSREISAETGSRATTCTAILAFADNFPGEWIGKLREADPL